MELITGAVHWIDHHESLGVWLGSTASLLVACVAVGVVFLQRHFDRKAEADVELNRRRSLGFSMLMKLRSIHSTLTLLGRHIDKLYLDGERLGLTEPWQFITPMGNTPNRVDFSSEELEVLFSLEDASLFNGMTLIDQFYNSAILLQATFTARRVALTDLLPAKLRGEIGTIMLTEEQQDIVAPRAEELKAMATQMREHWTPDARMAGELLSRLNSRLALKLDLQVLLEENPRTNPSTTP